MPNAITAGKLLPLTITISSTGVILPLNISPFGNSFYIVESPIPLIIRTNVSGNGLYQPQTGEAFGGDLTTLQIVSQTTNTSPAVSTTIQITIWVGYSSFQGFIDRRAVPPITSVEAICSILPNPAGFTPAIIAGQVIIPSGTVPGALAGLVDCNPAYGVNNNVNPVPNYNITGVILTNTDLTKTISLCTQTLGSGAVPPAYVCSLFPQQVIRLPYPMINTGSDVIKSAVRLLFANSSGGDVTITIALVIQTQSNNAF